MAQNWINKIKVGEQVYNIGVNSVLVFVGASTDDKLVDGYTGCLTINGEEYCPTTKGYVVLNGTKEFVSDGAAWREFGDESAFGITTTSTDVVDKITATTTAVVSTVSALSKTAEALTADSKSATVLSSAALTGSVSLTGTSASAITDITSSGASVGLTSSAETVVNGVSNEKIGLKLNTSAAADQALKSAELSGTTSFITEVSADATKAVNAVTGITSTAATISVANETLILPLEVLLSAAVGSTAAVVGGLTSTSGTVGLTTAAMDVLASASLTSVAAAAGDVDVVSAVDFSVVEVLKDASLNGTTTFLTEVESSGFANVLADASISNSLSVTSETTSVVETFTLRTDVNVLTELSASTVAVVESVTNTTTSAINSVSKI